MLTKIVSFCLNLRQLFVWRIEHEIYYRIFPHLRQERDHGYSFRSDQELQQFVTREHAKSLALLATLQRDSAGMPKAYGLAFRYIMYRELNQRLEQYEAHMRRCIRPDCDPQFVATRVPA